MKRKSVGIAVVIAALAVLVNVFALKSANVNSDVKVAIKTSGTSVVAITDTDGTNPIDPDISVTYPTSGQALIALAGAQGLQPGSQYTFYPAFYVKNNSNSTGDKQLTVSGGGTASGVTATFVDGSGNPINNVTLAQGASVAVGIVLDVNATTATQGTTATLTGTVDVH